MPDPEVVWKLGSVGGAADPTTVMESEGALYRLEDLLPSACPGNGDSAPTVRGILQEWDAWLPALDRAARNTAGRHALDADAQHWLPPVVFPDKLVCVGANYSDHLEEMGAEDLKRAPRPYAFLKPTTTGLIGDGTPIIAPAEVTWLDWEGELGVVIGRPTRRASTATALDAVAGYLPLNDVSARDWMNEGILPLGMDWIMHKSFDTFSPVGRFLTPARFVPDPQSLSIRTTVNGTVKQDSSTSRMIFSVREIIAHLSSVMTLQPGDIVATGSPAGVGFGRRPPERLTPGDVVRVQIDGLGAVANPVVAEDVA